MNQSEKNHLPLICEETPNPNAMKFYPGGMVAVNRRSISFNSTDNHRLEDSPLASALLSIDGVEEILFGPDFISITKQESYDWSLLKPEICLVILSCYFGPESVLGPTFYSETEGDNSTLGSDGDVAPLVDDVELAKDIEEILEEYIRPALLEDGGDIKFLKLHEGVVYIRLIGACSSCPGADSTIKLRIFNLLSAYLDEVLDVVAV